MLAGFFTTVAWASSALPGLIEGLARVSASSLNDLAGWLSDRSGKRKVFALAGVFALACYSLGFLLPKAHSVSFSVTDTVLLGYGLYGAIDLALVWASQSTASWTPAVVRRRTAIAIARPRVAAQVCIRNAATEAQWAAALGPTTRSRHR